MYVDDNGNNMTFVGFCCLFVVPALVKTFAPSLHLGVSTGITVFRLQIDNTGMSSNVMLLPYSLPCGTCNYAFMCGSWGYQIILWASWGGGFKLEFYWMTVKFQIILADFLCQESRKIKQKHN